MVVPPQRSRLGVMGLSRQSQACHRRHSSRQNPAWHRCGSLDKAQLGVGTAALDKAQLGVGTAALDKAKFGISAIAPSQVMRSQSTHGDRCPTVDPLQMTGSAERREVRRIVAPALGPEDDVMDV